MTAIIINSLQEVMVALSAKISPERHCGLIFAIIPLLLKGS
jgi:hypothetical protein